MKNNMTAANLRSAYGGESMAYMRYRVWGDKAKQEKHPNVGRLFDAVAFAEWAHARNHFNELKELEGDFLVPSMAAFGVGSLIQNLEWAKAGEDFEIEEMYPSYKVVAEMQKEDKALRSINFALAAEKNHSELFAKALTMVREGKDYSDVKLSVCPVCGHTREGDAPDRCPICGAPKERFQTF